MPPHFEQQAVTTQATRSSSKAPSVAKKAIVWSIAGSDSGGGAGIQADLLTMRAFGVHGCSLVTAITAQSSVEVALVEQVSEQMLAAQWQTLLTDLPPVAIKIGLVASRVQQQQLAALLASLAETLAQNSQQSIPVIVDPVLIASCGDALTLEQSFDVVPALPELPELYRYASLLTPNLPELAALTGLPVTSPDEIIAATKCLLAQGVRAVLVKGGHASGCKNLALDYLASATQQYWLASPRIDTLHNHGTGCSLSSAIVSALALGYPLDDAIVLAKAYLSRGLSAAYATGQGAGTLSHLPLPIAVDHFPSWLNTAQVQALYQGATLSDLQPKCAAFTPLGQAEMGLYPVVDSVAWLKRLLKLGINTIQLRIKTAAEKAQLTAEITAAIALGKQYQAQLFINDHWQLALELGAYGVHLGQEDLATADLTALQLAGIRLGVSTHGYAELLRAKALQPSYIALGHIFPTKTKQMPSKPQGLARLAQYLPLAAPYPTVAIGGITAERLAAVAATGVNSIAVVTAITEAADPEQATRALMALLAKAKQEIQVRQLAQAINEVDPVC
ncbi:bifunctional hydroxymethylpyrimidine kinase/phosphomethylpyrimidine kinase [Alishewanella longhuensis]|uniref:Thiamine-phosphate synthase n=1 Tax=Alishewanella longhuensis TaxID=1091037 RepID=A0ABQ3L3K9_9ALTE|nr:thiamine phosphate synthase [Alishewanella longhuensis]GHG71484.1 bifunctional hydroxymethylpyrimidine kinase/phosphomethylpyrimidine kinase [Alishewanella longhuensis]